MTCLDKKATNIVKFYLQIRVDLRRRRTPLANKGRKYCLQLISSFFPSSSEIFQELFETPLCIQRSAQPAGKNEQECSSLRWLLAGGGFTENKRVKWAWRYCSQSLIAVSSVSKIEILMLSEWSRLEFEAEIVVNWSQLKESKYSDLFTFTSCKRRLQVKSNLG